MKIIKFLSVTMTTMATKSILYKCIISVICLILLVYSCKVNLIEYIFYIEWKDEVDDYYEAYILLSNMFEESPLKVSYI